MLKLQSRKDRDERRSNDWRSYFRLMKYSMTITTRVMVYLTIATVSISFLNLLNQCFALLYHCFSTIYFSSYMPKQLKWQIWWWRLCVQAFIWSLISSTSKRNIYPHQIGHTFQWIYILDLLYLQRGMQWEGLEQFSIISPHICQYYEYSKYDYDDYVDRDAKHG